MMMFAFLMGSVLCDVVGQICFKIGVHHDDRQERRSVARFLAGLVRSRWIGLGVLVYVLEFVLWFGALTVAPLSFAVPFAALSYCGVVIASRLILREHVSARRWTATLVVAAGVAVVCWPTA